MEAEMPEISLTDFVDFVTKSGTPRLTKVRSLRDRGEYDPAADFWKGLREEIIKFHHGRAGSTMQIGNILKSVSDPKKIRRYSNAIAKYRKFIGRKKPEWFQPPRTEWNHAGLTIRINPELGLIWNKQRHVIKLYFKDDRLTKRKTDVVIALMTSSLSGKIRTNDFISVLDVHNSRLFTGCPYDLSPLLLGEAAAFVAIWDALSA